MTYMDSSQSQWPTQPQAQPQMPQQPGQQGPPGTLNNGTVSGGVNDMIRALMAGNQKYNSAQQAAQAAGTPPQAPMDIGAQPGGSPGGAPFAPNAGVPFMGAGGQPSPMMGALMSPPPQPTGGLY